MSKKTTRKAMLTSVVALVICFAMLVGTTYAWFTDSVASSGNIIKSGTLNIDLLIKTDADQDYVSVKGTPDKRAFNYELWEPGYTEWVNAKVATTGNLALKYTMKIIANGQVSALADVIDVYYKPAEVVKPDARDLSGLVKIGTLADALAGTIVINDTLIPDLQAYNGTAVTDADFATLALHMQESAGNEYQNLSIGTDFSLQILATQYTYEEDSFDDQYDAAAHLNFAPVASAAAFTDALSAGLSASLTQDVSLGETYQVTPAQEVVINGNGKTLSSLTGTRVINVDTAANASITLNGVTVDASDKERAVSIYGSDNVKLNIDDSSLSSDKYTINLASNSSDAKINIANTTVTGWCAVQTWSANATINVENSTLIGLNDKGYNAAGWNNFSTIVINEPANGSVITVKNSRIEANQTTGNKQTFLSFRAASGATVVFENCTFWKDGTQITDLQEIVNNIQFTSQAAIDNSHLTINGVVVLP